MHACMCLTCCLPDFGRPLVESSCHGSTAPQGFITRWGGFYLQPLCLHTPTVTTEMNHLAILGNCIAIVYPSCPQPVQILFTCLQSGLGLLHMLRKWHHFDIISPIICRQTCAGRRPFFFLFISFCCTCHSNSCIYSNRQLPLHTSPIFFFPCPSLSFFSLLNAGQVSLNYSSVRNEKSSWILNILSEVAANCASLCAFFSLFFFCC